MSAIEVGIVALVEPALVVREEAETAATRVNIDDHDYHRESNNLTKYFDKYIKGTNAACNH